MFSALLLINWSVVFDPYPEQAFPWRWWVVGAFFLLILVATGCRFLARKQREDRALKLQLRLMSAGLTWWSLGGLILTWLRSEATPWLGMWILLPFYGLLIVLWVAYSWWRFRQQHQAFLAKINAREERWRYLPGQKKRKRK